MADLSKIVLPNNDEYYFKDSTARNTANNALPKSGGTLTGNISLVDSNDVTRWILSDNGTLTLKDESGTNRLLIQPQDSNGHNKISAYNSSGSLVWSLLGDGTSTANPLPINQGGTGDSQTRTLSASTTATVGSISVSARQWGNVVSVILTCSNGSSVSAMNYFVRGSISGVTFPANTTVATVFSSGDLCACSINSSGTITARVMVGSVSANTNRVFQFTYLV